MSKYTTGEMAKICDVSVRTVQYYDSRGILTPCQLSEGGRRLYSEDDLTKLKVICFLRNVGLSINDIRQLLEEENPNSTIELLLSQQSLRLQDEINEKKKQLSKISEISTELKHLEFISVASINDVAYIMENKKNMKQLRTTLLIFGILLNIFELVTMVFCFIHKTWWPFMIWCCFEIIVSVLVLKVYSHKVAYICPHCHHIFQADFKDIKVFFSKHTPQARKLTCPHCHKHSFCVETYHQQEVERC